ncbi:helix-turn-helix transcriptional regulator [Paenibacillus larvae]
MRLVLNNKNVEEYMLKQGWDEREFAKRIGVSHVQVYRVLRGQRFPGNEFIAGMMSACENTEVGSLFKLIR